MFLSQEEFAEIVGPYLAGLSVGQAPGAFERAEESAARRITGATGIASPADSATAPAWAKETAAFIILYTRLGSNASIDRETRLYAREQYERVIAELPQNRERPVAKETSSRLGTIEGLIEW